MLAALAGTWRELAAEKNVRSVPLTGAGNRVFSADMDMTGTAPVSRRLARGEHVSKEQFEGLRSPATALPVGFDRAKPLVCAVNGHARAELTKACRRRGEIGKRMRSTEDAREAQHAFVEKRKPVWKGW